jgi:alpha-L-rhamnosidase
VSLITLDYLRCEYQHAPLGIDIRQPRLSWQLQSEKRGTRQTAYRILVTDDLAVLSKDEGTLWDSGQVPLDTSIQVVYQGKALTSRQRCYWKVMVWDEAGAASAWSDIAVWEMGLLESSDWGAQWISANLPEDKTIMQPCPMLRTEFTLEGTIKSARLYASSLGTYELHLNGQRVGDAYFTPGWTSYHKRLQYQTYEVTNLLQPGPQALGAILADGWYRGYTPNTDQAARNYYGDTLALLVQLEVTYEDGRVQVIRGNQNWKAATGPILHADHFMGEHYDARLEKEGWTRANYDDSNWGGVCLHEPPKTHLLAQEGPLVRKIQELKPVAILTTPAGETVADFGQNMVGWVRLNVTGEAGERVTLHHAEVLDKAGNFYTANLRAAKQRVEYTLKGNGLESYEPRFTFQGFRYVSLEHYPGTVTTESLTGIVLSSDTPPTGTFECSNPLVNQLQHNIVWGQRGNFLEVPTDCPQRNERLGWTGDAQVFIRTACFNTDVAGFFNRWLKDVVADQHEDGGYTHIVPENWPNFGHGATGWADAGIICPWTLYLCYGDTRILEQNYDSMTKWISYIQQRADKNFIWRSGFHFGDWLATDRNDLKTPFGLTENDLIATAFFAYSTSLMVKIADLLGKQNDARNYQQLVENIRNGFCNEFVTPSGRVGTNTQTAYVLALMFDLLPEAARPEAARRLAENIRSRGNHLATGFLGTPYLCHVLSSFGYLEVAYDLLLQETCPSWLYPVKLGATTIWERWDGITASGDFQDAGMNSFNHYAYGAIGDWLYRVVVGLELDETKPAYHHAVIRPQPGGGLSYAAATLQTMYGELASSWQLEKNVFHLQVTVPCNSSASIYLPHGALDTVTENAQPLALREGISSIQRTDAGMLLEVGSGSYNFSARAAGLK